MAPATEEDHIPARYLFRNKQWPEGYVFPACGSCNDSSAADELAMGFLVRIALSALSPQDEMELENAMRMLNSRRPEWIRTMREMSRLEMRRMVREQGLSLAQVMQMAGGEVYAMQMPDELLAVPQRYGRKLGQALYYLHSGRIVPREGVIRVHALTNAEFMSPNFPIEKFGVLHAMPTVVRASKSLEDQFSYRYGFASDTQGAAFAVQFRESTVLVIMVHEDPRAEAELRRRSGHAESNPSAYGIDDAPSVDS